MRAPDWRKPAAEGPGFRLFLTGVLRGPGLLILAAVPVTTTSTQDSPRGRLDRQTSIDSHQKPDDWMLGGLTDAAWHSAVNFLVAATGT
jgi:hypothetical protein